MNYTIARKNIFYACFAHDNFLLLPIYGPKLQIHLEILAMQPSLYVSRVVLVCRARAEVDLNKSTTEASSSYLSPLHFPSLLLESEC